MAYYIKGLNFWTTTPSISANGLKMDCDREGAFRSGGMAASMRACGSKTMLMDKED